MTSRQLLNDIWTIITISELHLLSLYNYINSVTIDVVLISEFIFTLFILDVNARMPFVMRLKIQEYERCTKSNTCIAHSPARQNAPCQ